MRELCQEWIADGGSPFDMVIAQDGNIIFHESFGSDNYGEFTINTPTEIASITKLFTGILFAQFVDQNIIGIDDLVGKYLPDFPMEGPRAITMRQCFTHTSGFYGHGLFDGVHNHWLENTLFQAVKNDTVGTLYRYNGMGYDLAGKVMESVTGKSIFRLFHEYLYEPLGMKNTIHDWDLGYSVHTTAYDLAIIAQMILNKGTYDENRYFSETTYEQILPKNLKSYYPELVFTNPWDEGRRGIGTTMQEWEISDEETGEKRHLLSKNVIGHGSATSSVFRIDLDNNIIITQSRRKGRSRFGEHFLKIYKLIDKKLVDPNVLYGSWAGAYGNFQFMPSTINNYAIDYDKNNKIELKSSLDDSLASAANYINKIGWKKGDPCFYRVKLTKKIDKKYFNSSARRLTHKLKISKWKRKGIVNYDGSQLKTNLRAALILPDGKLESPTYLVFDNYEQILKWNRSLRFGITVCTLANMIKI